MMMSFAIGDRVIYDGDDKAVFLVPPFTFGTVVEPDDGIHFEGCSEVEFDNGIVQSVQNNSLAHAD